VARAFVGTSGWAYASWKPKFYPPEVKTAGFLRHYATRLPTTEVNYTFRHLPTEKTAAAWLEATPPGFVFALKASERITHVKRLREPAETLPLFLERAALIGERLGPILFQTPPTLKRDDDRLAAALRAAWADERVHRRLASHAMERARAARRTWADVAADTRRIYAEVGARRGA